MDIEVKKSNKENSRPEAGEECVSRCVVFKQKLIKPEPLQSKNDAQEVNVARKQSKPPNKPAAVSVVRKTLSQVFHTQQSASVPPKSVPGTYKGRVVKSKIDCFRKPVTGDEKTTDNQTNLVRSNSEVRTLSKVCSKSVTALPDSSKPRLPPHMSRRVMSESDKAQKAVVQTKGSSHSAPKSTMTFFKQPRVPTRPQPASMRPAAVPTRPPISSSRPHTASLKKIKVSAGPSTDPSKPATVPMRPTSTSSKPATMPMRPTSASSRSATVSMRPKTTSTRAATVPIRPKTASTRAATLPIKPTMSSKPTSIIKKTEASVQNKPRPVAHRPVLSTKSQYRIRVESAEERQAKLETWLASKGKTLKRPMVTEKAAHQTCKEAGPKTIRAPQEAAQKAGPSKVVFSSSPSHIINTTLDLLDNSDPDLPADSDIRMELLVVNLCDRLEAMETPSSCKRHDEKEAEMVPEPKVKEGTNKEYEILEEEGLEEKLKQKEQNESKLVMHEKEQLKSSEDDNDDEEEEEHEERDPKPAADVTEGCVVKYSVKTTPFLQSVKKKLEGEMLPETPRSRRKNNIKDLKYLTPVRRSSRIHRYSSRLPDMLNEHDPCISSLAELELLDSADTVYICRKNPALLQHQADIQNLTSLINEEH